MTNLTLRSADIPSIFRDIHKFGVGFDPIFDELFRMNSNQANVNYPPYNIVKQNDNQFYIEIAVAGFVEGEIDVQLEKNQLTVKGNKLRDEDTSVEYYHRGISSRNFLREFTLGPGVKVDNAIIANGILSIYLVREIPEEDKPKSIAITYTK